MYIFEGTQLENKKASYTQIRQFLNEYGFEEGGGWEYDHGFFDRKIEDNPGYLFIRIPVMVETGSFGEDEARVRIGTPFLLRHKYQRGLDDHVFADNSNALINQFSEPVDADATVKPEDVEKGKQMIQQLGQSYEKHFRI